MMKVIIHLILLLEFSPLSNITTMKNNNEAELREWKKFSEDPENMIFTDFEHGLNVEKIEEFIKSLLHKQQAELVAKVEGMKKDRLWAGTDDEDKEWVIKKYDSLDLSGADVSIGYNQALDDVLKEIKK